MSSSVETSRDPLLYDPSAAAELEATEAIEELEATEAIEAIEEIEAIAPVPAMEGSVEPPSDLTALHNFVNDMPSDASALFGFVPLAPSDREGALGKLDHYDIMNVVGCGAMGVVVRAFDTQLSRIVAIKVMSPQLMTSGQARARFVREARAAASINHPNVVTIHAVSEQAVLPYLVMEYVDGRSLHDRIRVGPPLGLTEVLRISAQIAGGLAAAHHQGVIHRDIKPANIMLEDSIERVKITDFGLARVIQDQSDLTSQGGMVGTPAYMSPEQVNGATIDARSDLFSLGCVMYAMIAGHSPFRGENALGTARRIASMPHRSLADLSKDVPPFFSEMVDRLLKKEPADRYQTAEEVQAELTHHLASLNRGIDPEPVRPSRSTLPQGRQTALIAVLIGLLLITIGVHAGSLARGPWALISPIQQVAQVGPAPRPEPATSATADDAEDRLPGALLTVSQSGGAMYTRITEALRHAGPGSTIRVEDSGTYEVPLVLDDPHAYADLRLESTAGAVLRAPRSRPVLIVSETPGVSVRGFRFETSHGQHAIEMDGDCSGALVEDCDLVIPAGSPLAAIYLHTGAAGTEEAPIVFRNLRVTCGGVGFVAGAREDTTPVRHVIIEECQFRAARNGFGIPMVLQYRVEDLVVRNNLFATGNAGISLLFPDPNTASGIKVVRNSFGNLAHGFAFNQSESEQAIEIADNLFVETDTVHVGGEDIGSYADWFNPGNWWERGPQLIESEASRIAELKDSLPVLSRGEPDRPDYLMPQRGAQSSMPGRHVH